MKRQKITSNEKEINKMIEDKIKQTNLNNKAETINKFSTMGSDVFYLSYFRKPSVLVPLQS